MSTDVVSGVMALYETGCGSDVYGWCPRQTATHSMSGH